MKSRRIEKLRGKCSFSLIVLACLVTLTGYAHIAEAIYSIPSSRAVSWQGNVGVTGDIPDRTTICATLSPSGSNDSTAINNAINSCPSGQVVKLNAGTFLLNSYVSMKSGVTLRGSGMGTTILQGTITARNASVITLLDFKGTGYSAALTNEPSFNITGGLTKGSTTITTSAPHGWSVGDIILIDQLSNPTTDPPIDQGDEGCSYCGRPFSGTIRALGQVSKVVGTPTATTATVEIPTYWNYDINYAPQGTRMDGLISYAGVEDLTVDNMLSGNGNQESYGTVAMEAAQNCWLLRTEVKGSWRSIVKLYSAYRNTIRSSKFHESIPATPINGVQYGSGRGYGLHLAPWASANLLEDNIIYHLSSGIIFTSVVSGNVFSYNYITDLYYIDNTWEREAIFAHGMFPVMNLYEGNWTNGIIGADYYHGNSSYNTIFRNRHPGVLNPETGNPKTNIVWGLAIAKHSWYYNIIGNVLGEAGLYTQYELLNSNSYGIKAAYVLGYGGGDSNVKNTVLRHGNWDNVTNGVMWNGADDKSLPASLYRSSKPSWWGNQPWPPIGPDVPGYAASIPAKDRFLNVTPAKIPSAPFLH